jgi:hypothetical protein
MESNDFATVAATRTGRKRGLTSSKKWPQEGNQEAFQEESFVFFKTHLQGRLSLGMTGRP